MGSSFSPTCIQTQIYFVFMRRANPGKYEEAAAVYREGVTFSGQKENSLTYYEKVLNKVSYAWLVS